MNEMIDEIEKLLSDVTEIATGGQKAVYSAQHPKFGKVAFKKVNNLDKETKMRMEREAKILQELEYDFFPKLFLIEFSLDERRCIIIEEYIESKTLSALQHNYYDPEKALLLIRDLVEILSIVWKKNIVHRDLKPENILIDNNGKIRIIDFGCARELDEKTITEFGGAPLTWIYAAPEQIRYDKKFITVRTDQFAIGIILGKLIFKGTHPFDPSLTQEPNIVSAILNNNWYRTGLRNLPNLKQLLERLLHPQSHSRYPSPERIIDAIDLAIGEVS